MTTRSSGARSGMRSMTSRNSWRAPSWWLSSSVWRRCSAILVVFLSKTEIEEGENEVEQHGEGKVADDAVVWKVDGSVIFESWIVVGVMAMLEHVDGEEEERLEQR